MVVQSPYWSRICSMKGTEMKNLITRRAFLIDAVSFGGSVILREEIVQSLIDYFTAEGKPLLIPPSNITNTIYATQI